VRLGKTSRGARYDELKPLICEIQVRTVLQDAWATIAHHLSYKQESHVPPQLRRKLNALSASFETADDQFERIRADRRAYAEKTKEGLESSEPHSLEAPINFDNLMEYLEWRFPDRESAEEDDAADLLSELWHCGYRSLSDLKNLVDRCYDAVRAYEEKYPPIEKGQRAKYSPTGVIRTSLSLADESYSQYDPFRDKLMEFKHMVKD